jgi:hypothetical protein
VDVYACDAHYGLGLIETESIFQPSLALGFRIQTFLCHIIACCDGFDLSVNRNRVELKGAAFVKIVKIKNTNFLVPI